MQSNKIELITIPLAVYKDRLSVSDAPKNGDRLAVSISAIDKFIL